MEYITESASETQNLGQKVASNLTSKTKIFALTGELGSGKTTFVQGFARGLGVKKRIISPTFILMRSYKIVKVDFDTLYHLDLYRFEKDIDKELDNLGIEEVWKDRKNIIIIEWAEKARKYIPKEAVWIKFENVSEERRKITIRQNNI